MVTLKLLGLTGGLTFLLICGPTSATNLNTLSQASTSNAMNAQQSLSSFKLAHDTGYGHVHGKGDTYSGSGRIRSYEYCSQNVFEPCRQSGGSYRYCNRLHHLCTYGHLRNCIKGSTC
ncbi:Uncharacterised protein [Legionella beliardensis]|uniref:Uncharacterized protein n=1 Tax=Legionella beliardensis TaxID=91822 RepID=A0A378I095_9GAMM|nr:hypothetical protein [Legionella beliardensis]STX27996.1 Uncharacterised protein [Legionella beliardensis]